MTVVQIDMILYSQSHPIYSAISICCSHFSQMNSDKRHLIAHPWGASSLFDWNVTFVALVPCAILSFDHDISRVYSFALTIHSSNLDMKTAQVVEVQHHQKCKHVLLSYSYHHVNARIQLYSEKSMALCKTAVTPICQHWSFLPEASFGHRLLSLPASVCVSVCVSITCLSAR